MRILITGAGGLVGAALARHYESRADVFPLLHRELDITDERQTRERVDSIRPDLIINCAVMGVDECERDPEAAARLNVQGPALLANAASRRDGAIIHFSTNYVFSGDRTDEGFYLTGDAAIPINMYGRTKLEGEQAVESACSRSWIIRTSWVFGWGKESFLATAAQKLQRGETIQAITDIFASATYVRDLVHRVDEIVQLRKYGTYHVNNAGVCSYAQFAHAAAGILGLSDSERTRLIQHQTAADVMRTASRPRWTPMHCDHSERIGLPPLRPWHEALAAYIAEG